MKKKLNVIIYSESYNYKSSVHFLNNQEVLTMFLTAVNIFWPVAGVGVLVVEQASDAELFRGGPVPASPVPGAGGLVPEDAV